MVWIARPFGRTVDNAEIMLEIVEFKFVVTIVRLIWVLHMGYFVEELLFLFAGNTVISKYLFLIRHNCNIAQIDWLQMW